MRLVSFINNFRDQLSKLGWYTPEEIRAMCSLLLEELAGIESYKSITEPELELPSSILEQLLSATNELAKGRPLQYVLGYGWFYGRKFILQEGVLIPRPETEELVKMLLDDIKAKGLQPRYILDICTGSGCIAWTLQLELKDCFLSGCDISSKALEIARSQFKEREDVRVPNFFKCDILNESIEQVVSGKYDIIVSNPPYVCMKEMAEMRANVLEYEPSIALFVPDSDPLLFYKKIALQADLILHPGGLLYLEINERFSTEVASLLSELKFTEINQFNDLFGKPRFVRAKKC